METFNVLQVSIINYFFCIFTVVNGKGKTDLIRKDQEMAANHVPPGDPE